MSAPGSWKDVLDCSKMWHGHIGKAIESARRVGYEYIAWNGRIYGLVGDDRIDTGILARNLAATPDSAATLLWVAELATFRKAKADLDAARERLEAFDRGSDGIEAFADACIAGEAHRKAYVVYFDAARALAEAVSSKAPS